VVVVVDDDVFEVEEVVGVEVGVEVVFLGAERITVLAGFGAGAGVGVDFAVFSTSAINSSSPSVAAVD